ncbi:MULTISPECIES: DUF6146 family protein [unclassified Tenacibaculum]|uniref:DUF6146 family protein n=1 Tax=unclassified Tenacibaculum TaxID=2635139 RepID=UPI001F16F2D7|nr:MULTISPECIES: DUF6146 family protein [unclassified Tenacibaculum]MCF2873595.1 DUF6146 family protein [Tenacibaculum sp. Cn5-1]MCF2933751.1 DUF6146 family protein [Tenacibaculum sp. Cn5-34]MCG7509667.1 DUF6146 family protein [Tenacibaculum sp. Cn5-46]
MKTLKYFSILSLFLVIIYACSSSPIKNSSSSKEEPVVIKNDSLEYEITIIDPGFNYYLNTVARPVGFYSKTYLANKNRLYVPVWNSRVNNPNNFDPNIYENQINYRPNIDYGYEVNYKLFNYFEFAQRKYRMRLR